MNTLHNGDTERNVDEVMTSADVRGLLKMSPTAFRALVKGDRGPPHFRVSRHSLSGLRFHKIDVLKWIAGGGATGAYKNAPTA